MTLPLIYAQTLTGSVPLARVRPIDPATGLPAVDANGNPIYSDWSYASDSRYTTSAPVTTLNAITPFALGLGQGVVGFQITGLTASGAVLTPVFSNDGGTTWHPHSAVGAGGIVSTITADGAFDCSGAGHTNVALQVTTVGTGSISVTANASVASGFTKFASPQPVVLGTPGNGSDASANAPAGLAILSTFMVATPGSYFVQNQSAGTLQVIFDNGSGGAVSIQLLDPGAGAGRQGGDTNPPMLWFIGRIQVAGASGAQFMARHN